MLWITIVEWLARLILVLLIGLSFWSVTIIIERKRFFAALKVPGEKLKNDIKTRQALTGESHFYSEMLTDISRLKRPEQIDKAFDAFAFRKKKELEKELPVLGTMGSTTPFVGLPGTILGIIVSFGELSRGTGSTNSVMFSLAEALILTAVGLIVAIPAVVAFNYFNRKSRMIIAEASSLKDLYIAYRD